MEDGVIELPEAVALATGNVTEAIPRAAPNRGVLAPGKVADIIVTRGDSSSEIETVVIGGRITVEEGKLV